MINEVEDEAWFSMGMTKEEKLEHGDLGEITYSSNFSVVVRDIVISISAFRRCGESISPVLIDLFNVFFTVKLSRREKYERAPMDGPRMIGENYLHV